MKKLNLIIGVLLLASSSTLAGTISYTERNDRTYTISLELFPDGQTVTVDFPPVHTKHDIFLPSLKNAVTVLSIVDKNGSNFSPYWTVLRAANSDCEARWMPGCAFDIAIETIELPVTSLVYVFEHSRALVLRRKANKAIDLALNNSNAVVGYKTFEVIKTTLGF